MTVRLPQRGLYAILNAGDDVPDPGAAAAQALAGGAVMLQYRDKVSADAQRVKQAAAVLTACKHAGVPLIINDDPELCARIEAQGVHLGRADTGIAPARRLLGPNAIIGATCHARLDLAEQAVAAGADYVSFGRFFASQTKPGAPPAPLDTLNQARAKIACPVVAIGGINADNGGALIARGADLLAVSGALFSQPDISAAARQFAHLFEH